MYKLSTGIACTNSLNFLNALMVINPIKQVQVKIANYKELSISCLLVF